MHIVNPRESLERLTRQNPFDRFPDGRPHVPDDLIERMKLVTTEEAWGVLRKHGYNYQFEGDWFRTHPDRILVGRAVTDELQELIDDGRILEFHRRPYEPADLDGCFLVIAGTNLDAVNRMVWQDAEALNMLCNIVDVPPMCNFIVPSIVRRGELAIAISTGGASPVVAKHIRRELEATYGPEWEALVDLLRELREDLKVRYLDMPSRRDAVERLMETDVIQRLAGGDDAGARALARSVLDLEREVHA